MIKAIFNRNIVLFIILGLVMAFGVDWEKCFEQRGKYLLGIFYNGHFQNDKDGQVYQDYLKRHGMDHESFKRRMNL